MEEENFTQQELFEQKKYISDLVEESTSKNKSSLNIIFGSSIITSIIVLSFLYVYGIFEEEEIVLPEPITITETIKEKELVVPRVDSTEVVSIAEIATKTIVQVQVGERDENTFSLTSSLTASALGAWILFGIVFMWTPAHFWALSILHKDDYANASFPMLPNTASERETIKYIAIYSCSTLLMSLLAAPVLQLGLVYLFIAIALGTHLIINVLHLYQDKRTPGSFFALSNTYLALLFLGIVIDVLWTLRLIEI